MNTSGHTLLRSPRALTGLTVLALVGFAGCKSNVSSIDDGTLTANIQKQLSADSAIAGQPIQTVVSSAVVTLSGTVTNDAQRTIAARDAASVPGVKEVVNNISTAPVSAQVVAPPPAEIPVSRPAIPTRTQTLKPQPTRQQPAPIERPQQAYNQPTYNPPPQVQQPAPQPTPQPSFRTVTLPSGSVLPIRITQTLDSATTVPDSSFSGVLASDVLSDGLVAIPAGSNVSGNVDAVHEAGHFKGSSLLTISLTNLTRRGDRISLTTEPYTVAGKGRGANTAEKTGGGAAVGAILGGIFGGGKGAAIGAAAGGGVGAGSNAITRGQQVQIESESVVRFRLANPITVRVRTDNLPDTRTGDLERRHTNQP